MVAFCRPPRAMQETFSIKRGLLPLQNYAQKLIRTNFKATFIKCIISACVVVIKFFVMMISDIIYCNVSCNQSLFFISETLFPSFHRLFGIIYESFINQEGKKKRKTARRGNDVISLTSSHTFPPPSSPQIHLLKLPSLRQW